MHPSKSLGLGLLALILVILPATPAPACPNCKEAIAADSEQAGDVSTGYSRSILLMMSMPFALLGIGTMAVVRVARRGGIPQL